MGIFVAISSQPLIYYKKPNEVGSPNCTIKVGITPYDQKLAENWNLRLNPSIFSRLKISGYQKLWFPCIIIYSIFSLIL